MQTRPTHTMSLIPSLPNTTFPNWHSLMTLRSSSHRMTSGWRFSHLSLVSALPRWNIIEGSRGVSQEMEMHRDYGSWSIALFYTKITILSNLRTFFFATSDYTLEPETWFQANPIQDVFQIGCNQTSNSCGTFRSDWTPLDAEPVCKSTQVRSL